MDGAPGRRVLVTGASGLVGGHVAERLAAAGWQVRALVRARSNRRWLEPLGADFAEGDVLGQRGLREACAGCEAVVHCAGLTNAVHPSEYFRVNTEGTLRLWMAAEATGVRRFLYVSSLAAAGPSRGPEPQDESAEPQPVNAYGRCKLEGERAVLGLGSPIEALAVRPPAVYGPRDADFLPLFRLARRGWFPKIGRRPRHLSLVHAADLGEGIRLALERGRRDAVYYLTDGAVHEVFQMGQEIGAALGRRVRPLYVPHAAFWIAALAGELQAGALRRAAPVNFDRLKQFLRTGWTASDARARIELGYRPRYDLPQGVEDTVRWYRSVGWI